MSALDKLVAYVTELLEENGGASELPDVVRADLLPILSLARAEVIREMARLLEATGRDDDAVNLLDNMASAHEPGGTAAVPVPDETGEAELAELRELKRRVTEQLEDFEEGLEEDPGAPAVAHNMTQLLARAVRGESR